MGTQSSLVIKPTCNRKLRLSMHDRLQPKFQANAVMLQHFVGHLKFLHF